MIHKEKFVVNFLQLKLEHCNKTIQELYCSDCDDCFCNSCFDKIHQSVKWSKHKKLPLEKQKKKCPTHQKPLESYCFDCDLQLCISCVLDNHKNHNSSSFETAANKIKEILFEFMKNSNEENLTKEIDDNKVEIQELKKKLQILEKKQEDLNVLLNEYLQFKSSITLSNEFQELYQLFKGKEKILKTPNIFFKSKVIFDSQYCSSTVKISDNGKVCTFLGNDGFNSSILCTYAEEWTIRLNSNSKYLMIGMCNKKMSIKGANYQTNNGYYLYLGTGGLYCGSFSNLSYAKSFTINGTDFESKGTVIKMKFDPKKGSLSYTINGTDFGVAFKDLAGKDLYPAIDFYQSGTILEIID